MASIVHRKNSYYVVYRYKNLKGVEKQKWERFDTKEAATRRQKEVDYKKSIGAMVIPECHTVDELLDEFVEHHGKEKWSVNTYWKNKSLIKMYISPFLGKMKIANITTRLLETYYQQLLSLPQAGNSKEHITPSIVRDVKKILNSAFKMAVKWDLLERNPAMYADAPKYKPKKREIWTTDELFHAIDVCDNERLKLCMNLSFACTLRISEVLGLTWDCVNISEEAVDSGKAYVFINKQIQRVSRKAMAALGAKDIIKKFETRDPHSATLLVLKAPKTESSIRKVFLPRTVAEMLIEWKKKQNEQKAILGPDYEDNNLVICTEYGKPTEENRISREFDELIEKNGLRKVVFHSIRHTSVTYKLKLNGGDVKAVQGDSGHSQTSMVTDVYSHILDEGRRKNAEEIEAAFYSDKKSGNNSTDNRSDIEDNIETIAYLMKNPELLNVLKTLMS